MHILCYRSTEIGLNSGNVLLGIVVNKSFGLPSIAFLISLIRILEKTLAPNSFKWELSVNSFELFRKTESFE